MREILDRNKSNNAYRVPEGYFSNLNARIMQSVKDAESTTPVNATATTPKDAKAAQKTTGGIFHLSPRYRYAVAACFTVAIVIAGIVAFNYTPNNEEQSIVDNIDKIANNQQQNNNEMYSEEYQQECLEYAMVDNDDMYIYLAEQ